MFLIASKKQLKEVQQENEKLNKTIQVNESLIRELKRMNGYHVDLNRSLRKQVETQSTEILSLKIELETIKPVRDEHGKFVKK